MLPKINRVLLSFAFLIFASNIVFAQAPTSADVMRDRISNAKAHLVVKNYTAAIYELENIRRETNDRTINRVINVLLMHAYLEQGDFKRIQKFLNELYRSKKAHAQMDYLAVAGQVVSGAKTQRKRYQVLGLDVADEKLPSYAVEDLDQMRKTLELVIKQSKALGKVPKISPNAMALLEETSSARSNLARDEYDAKRWENEVVFARQQIANSGSKVINAVQDSPINAPDPNIVAANNVEQESTNGVDKPEENMSIPPVEVDRSEEPAEPKTESTDPGEVKTGTETEKKPEKVKDPQDASEKKPEPAGVGPRPTDRKIRIIGSAAKTPKEIAAAEAIKARNSGLLEKNPDMFDKEKTKTDPAENEQQKPNTKTEQKKPRIKTIRSADDTVAKKIPAKQETPKTENNEAGDSPISIGPLIGYATKRVKPVYPPQAKSLRMGGIVKVELIVDEDGRVAKVAKTEGPPLLKRAAQNAVRKWQFTPFTRDGQPVKASGFVSFNFNL